MKRAVAAFAVAMFALVVCGAAEGCAPKPWGTGLPFLLAASLRFAARRPAAEGFTFAAAAGAFEDSLSSLPFAVSVSFFAASAALARRFGHGPLQAALLWCAFQAWLWIWTGSASGGVFARVPAALPAGFLAALLVEPALAALDRKAALE